MSGLGLGLGLGLALGLPSRCCNNCCIWTCHMANLRHRSSDLLGNCPRGILATF